MLFRQLDIDKEESEYRKERIGWIATETIDKVKTFYERDDISQIMPGKHDVVTVRTDQGKQKFQERHLYMSLRVTHNTFIKENPKMHTGLTKFGMLHPSHVKFSSQTPANVCTCVCEPSKHHSCFGCHEWLQ